MGLLRTLGFGRSALLQNGMRTQGQVTRVSECRFIKVNTKPIRSCSADGARYPHIVHYRYAVNGTEYAGSAYLPWNAPCPCAGQAVTVCYRAGAPEDSAALLE